MYFFKTEFLNTTGEAGRMCDKVIPHTNVTISVDNRPTNATYRFRIIILSNPFRILVLIFLINRK